MPPCLSSDRTNRAALAVERYLLTDATVTVGARAFKIGRTMDPDRRWAAHDYRRYDEMVLIYETPHLHDASQVEGDLTEMFPESDNVVRGGAGGGGLGWHFVYVVVAY